MPTIPKSYYDVRIPEHNDWVIFIILACLFALIFMIVSLQRENTLKDFLVQEFADSSNGFMSWIIVSVVYILSFSVLISQYIPTVPKFVSSLNIFGIQLNKFGFTLWVVSLFYALKTLLSYFLYQSTGSSKKWSVFYFTVTKFYFVLAVILMIFCIALYYFQLDKALIFRYFTVFFAFLVLFKIFFYLLHKNAILPSQWYYKFLYICTLQIVPYLVLWKILFF